jgi:hypothetical protein
MAMRSFSSLAAILAIASSLVLTACGGGGSSAPAAAPAPAPAAPAPAPADGGGASDDGSTPDANVVAITVDAGTNGQAFNLPFVTVTVCVPGTSTCQQVDHVLVDTGSFGLRLDASALDAQIALPKLTAPLGNTLSECAPFASGIAWGSVRTADVRIGGEVASALPVQVVNDPSIAAPPRSCTSQGSNFGVGNGAKGILGIGVFAQDCGTGCALSAATGRYYGCDASTCTPSAAAVSSQVTNPIAFFPTDNNGVKIVMPSVPLTGATTLAGTLTFGVGTRANNQLGTATVYTTDSSGSVQTTYNGTRYTSFFDTGSNALFFPDPNLPQCSGGFYCPTSPQTLSAIVTSAAGVSTTVSFTIQGLQSLSSGATAAPVGGSSDDVGRAFDWGLPFFFGRTVFVAMSGASTPGGTGPYLAF